MNSSGHFLSGDTRGAPGTTDALRDWSELDWSELDWSELDWSELDWSELDWSELDWSEP
jgi:hypothetical protein